MNVEYLQIIKYFERILNIMHNKILNTDKYRAIESKF
jgi:hypothetical protein